MRKSMKFFVRDAAHSRKVQEALFASGYRWAAGGTTVQHTDKPYLYVDGSIITYGVSQQCFQEHSAHPIELKVEVKYNFNDAPTVELRGKTYLISEVEVALAQAKAGIDE